ncbi:MAG: hypothetical protein U1E05_10025, partial [Patescibacteria group bacterium]|nr:hypothetical protein [Patescibacteria group bacterium]
MTIQHALVLAGCLLTTFGQPSLAQSEPLATFVANDGKTSYVIVAADEEPQTAATGQVPSLELKDHLEAITGAVFPVVKESAF